MQNNELIPWFNRFKVWMMLWRNPQPQYLTDLIKKSALVLDKCRMIRFNPQTELLAATDLGRTASHFYIKHPTIEHFNSTFKPNLLEAEILGCISQADEFAQLKVRLINCREIERTWCNRGEVLLFIRLDTVRKEFGYFHCCVDYVSISSFTCRLQKSIYIVYFDVCFYFNSINSQ